MRDAYKSVATQVSFESYFPVVVRDETRTGGRPVRTRKGEYEKIQKYHLKMDKTR